VYTAETARQLAPPYPSKGSAATTSPYGSSGTDSGPEEVNAGFVEPIDFNSFLSNVAYDPKKSTDLNPFTSESKSRDAFPDFFKNGQSTERSYFEPAFGALSSSASNQVEAKLRNSFILNHSDDDFRYPFIPQLILGKFSPNFIFFCCQNTRKPQEESEDGFVDPSVQFRSLFDSTETADGFRPQDFLNYKVRNNNIFELLEAASDRTSLMTLLYVIDSKGEAVAAEPSKGSQTRTYPSFTYTGREGQDDGSDYEASPPSDSNNPRYRSSYRQVDSREREGNRDPYDDRNYYGGERDESPPPPRSPPPRRYTGGLGGSGDYGQDRRGEAPSYAPTGQETAHAPQATGSKPKGAESSGGVT
jgi:hypothetical protein